MNKIRVMVVGFPRQMAFSAVKEINESNDIELIPLTLAEEGTKIEDFQVIALEKQEEKLKEIKPDIVVDFSDEFRESLYQNAKLYCELGISFIIGLVGNEFDILQFDNLQLEQTVENSKSSVLALMGIYSQSYIPGRIAEAIRFLVKNNEKGTVFSEEGVALSN